MGEGKLPNYDAHGETGEEFDGVGSGARFARPVPNVAEP